MSLSQLVADLDTHFRSVEDTAKTFLEQHVPALLGFAQKVESSPLLSIAEAIVGTIDPAAEQVLARALQDLAGLIPAAAAPAPADAAPEAVAEPPLA